MIWVWKGLMIVKYNIPGLYDFPINCLLDSYHIGRPNGSIPAMWQNSSFLLHLRKPCTARHSVVVAQKSVIAYKCSVGHVHESQPDSRPHPG